MLARQTQNGAFRLIPRRVGAGSLAGPSLPRAYLHASAPRCDASSATDELLTSLKTGLKEAMKAKDSFRSTVIRSVISEQQYAEKEGKGSSVSGILQKAVARRQESARQFRAAKPPREDLAEKEDREAALIQDFLPSQMPTAELEGIVRQAIGEAHQAGIEGKKMMGEVMKRVNQQVDKARAPGSVVSEMVRKLLQ